MKHFVQTKPRDLAICNELLNHCTSYEVCAAVLQESFQLNISSSILHVFPMWCQVTCPLLTLMQLDWHLYKWIRTKVGFNSNSELGQLGVDSY